MHDFAKAFFTMFDATTVVFAVAAVVMYLLGHCVVDPRGALHFASMFMPAGALNRLIRSLMLMQVRAKHSTGGTFFVALWRATEALHAFSCERVLETGDEKERWRAVVRIGQIQTNDVSEMDAIRKVANTNPDQPSGRAAAAVLKERSMAATAGR